MKKSTELLHNKLPEQEMRKFVLDCYPVSSVENFVFRIKILLCNDRIFLPRLQDTSSLLFLGAVRRESSCGWPWPATAPLLAPHTGVGEGDVHISPSEASLPV